MIVLHATLSVDPDSLDDAIDLATDLAQASREEDGVLEYRVTQDVEDGSIRIIERYEDDNALSSHMGSDHFAAFQSAVVDVLAGPPSLVRYDVAADQQLM